MKPVKPCLDLMNAAIEEHNPVAVFAMFSGGHDSLTATHIAAQHPKFTAAVHINTGIGIEKTRQFVRDTCEREGWPLREYKAEDYGMVYADIVKEYGFPGSDAHKIMYSKLKERGLRACIREAKTKVRDRVMLVTGVRSQESIRRMGHVKRVSRDGVKVWVAPIHDWSKSECNEYIDEKKLKRNEVVDLIHMSGECLCGAYAHKGELKEIEMWFPEVAHQIHQLEREVGDAGFPWRWEEQPPKWFKESKRGQAFLCEMKVDMTMCQSCDKRYSDRVEDEGPNTEEVDPYEEEERIARLPENNLDGKQH